MYSTSTGSTGCLAVDIILDYMYSTSTGCLAVDIILETTCTVRLLDV